MLSESTARLVGHACLVGDREMVNIKGADAPVSAYRLLGVADEHETTGAGTVDAGRS